MPKYRIPNIKQFAVAGDNYKPDKDGVFDMPSSVAQHLSATYYVAEQTPKGEVVLGKGTANVQAEGAQKSVSIDKTSLTGMSREELEKRCDALHIKVEKDWSKGDMAEAIVSFMKRFEARLPGR